MKTVAFVPIKMNNERLPKKNVKPFSNGIPLIDYIQQCLKQVSNVDESYIYCSDEAIQKYMDTNSIRFLKREAYLDLSETPFNEVLITFAEKVEADIYVLTHTTAPFIKASSIEAGVQAVKSGEYDSAVGVCMSKDFLWDQKGPINYDPLHIPRTQDLPPMYIETCGLYVYRREVILEQKRRIGNNPFLVQLSKVEAIDINEPIDFTIADAVASAMNLKPGNC